MYMRLSSLGVKKTNILQGVDALGGLLDLTSNNLGDELVGELGESAGGGLALDDLGHLLANGTDLRRTSVGGLLDLVGASLGEGNGEQAEEVVVSGLHGDVGLDQGLPLADKGTELVGGEVETVEVGQAVLALDLVDAELDLAEGVVLIVLEVGEGNLEDTALEGVVGVLQTAGAVDQSLADTDDSVSQSISKTSPYSIRVVCILAGLEGGRSLSRTISIASGRMEGIEHTFTEYSSLRVKGSTVRFLIPFLPLDRRLFLNEED